MCYEMLHGQPPFFNQDEALQLEEIAKGSAPPLPARSFGKLSLAGKDFLRRLLEPDARRRMRIEEALQHRWLQPVQDAHLAIQMREAAVGRDELAERRAERKRAEARRRLKAATQAVMAGNRLSRLSQRRRSRVAEEEAAAAARTAETPAPAPEPPGAPVPEPPGLEEQHSFASLAFEADMDAHEAEPELEEVDDDEAVSPDEQIADYLAALQLPAAAPKDGKPAADEGGLVQRL